MNKKILITGASGFIGTNLLEDLLKHGYNVLNIDINCPKIPKRSKFWMNIDITDYRPFRKAILDFQPDYIIHLAARTDLDGRIVKDYSANTKGVRNLLRIVNELPNLRKIIITSSKFVCRNGYYPKNQFDYSPHTVYGKSKVITEKAVWSNKPHCDWCIIRPTSIWGPWFGVPYRDFFDIVMKGLYFHIGNLKCYKTYGYIGNSIYQIKQLLFNDTYDESNKVFYIGDNPVYEISDWADELGRELELKIPKVPYSIIKCAALFGDVLKLFGIKFPMTSFRLNNMINDNINDLSNTYIIAPLNPYCRLEGIKSTIIWLNKHKIKSATKV